MWKTVFSDRRLGLLLLVLVLVGVLGRWAIPASVGFKWVVGGGYWITLSLVVLFGRASWPLLKERCRVSRLARFDLYVLAGVLAVVAIWVSHERPGYKILADELLLSGTAMGLHYERDAGCPIRATDVQGAFQIIERSFDKRPLFYPFLVATAHDLTGYRAENAFYVNIVLSGVFLWLVYLTGWAVGGSRWAGVLVGLLFAGLPLMAQQATGGGFELLNLLLITVVVLLIRFYLERPDKNHLEALVFAALLLASTRYESVIFLAPVAAAAAAGWWRSRSVVLSWPLVVSPVFLLPWILQNRLFSENTAMWQMQGQSGVTEPFGLQYFAPNLGHALAYFFDFSGYATNSPVFALLGLLSLPILALAIIRTLRESSKASGSELGTAVAGAGLFAVALVYMFYFWGKFDDPIISRLSLPIHLLMAVAAAKAGSVLFKNLSAWKAASLIALGGLLLHGLPVIARQAYRTNYNPGVEMQMRDDFWRTVKDRTILFIDNDSYFWVLKKVPASPVRGIQTRKPGLSYHMRNHSFQEMYVFQSILVNEETGERYVDPEDDMGPGFELETVWEKRVRPLLFARISRIVSITDGDKTTTKPVAFVEPSKETLTSAELEKRRDLYLENWVRQLP